MLARHGMNGGAYKALSEADVLKIHNAALDALRVPAAEYAGSPAYARQFDRMGLGEGAGRAAAAALLPIGPLGVALGAAGLVAVVALFARRVSGTDPSTRPTV